MATAAASFMHEKVCAVKANVCELARPCDQHVAITVELATFPPSTPGQFLELLCHPPCEDRPRTLAWEEGAFPQLAGRIWRARDAYLRRPFSIADRYETSTVTRLVVLSRAIGAGTTWLDALRVDDTLDLTGPLGRGFTAPALSADVALVGGGVGMPPMLYFARRLREIGHAKVTIIFGAQRRELFPIPLSATPATDGAATRCVVLPGNADYPAIITTDDGSLGMHGRVTDALARWSDSLGERRAAAMVYACGPTGMLKAISGLTRERGLACALCVERNMGCGLGTCLSCVLRLNDRASPNGWRWGLACTDGPVFPRDALYDDA